VGMAEEGRVDGVTVGSSVGGKYTERSVLSRDCSFELSNLYPMNEASGIRGASVSLDFS